MWPAIQAVFAFALGVHVASGRRKCATSCGGFADTLLMPTLTVVMTTKASTEYIKYSRNRLQTWQTTISIAEAKTDE